MYANNPNLYTDLYRSDLIPGMESGGILGTGRYIDVHDHKIHKFPAIDTNRPWIYVNPNPDMHCYEFQMIVKGFGFIPRRCLECWKVVVMPRSFHELMLLLDLQEKVIKDNPQFWCKCGIEERWFVPRHYGGYFYCLGENVGIVRYHTVRKLVNENISPDTNVILKRYCTEFELGLGPSDKYKRPDWADEKEKDIWDCINIESTSWKQPKLVKDHTIFNWMQFAWSRGDRTVTLYNNGRDLVPPSVTYHKGKG
jgi:hypothetical protein